MSALRLPLPVRRPSSQAHTLQDGSRWRTAAAMAFDGCPFMCVGSHHEELTQVLAGAAPEPRAALPKAVAAKVSTWPRARLLVESFRILGPRLFAIRV